MSRRPVSECESVEVSETYVTEIPKIEEFREANVTPLAYMVCGEGWSHYLEVEVVDIV
jgi:hypothetical protein